MTIKKKLSAMALSAVSAVLLSSCSFGGGSDTGKESSEIPSAQTLSGISAESVTSTDQQAQTLKNPYDDPKCDLPCGLPEPFVKHLKSKGYSKVADAMRETSTSAVLSFLQSDSQTGQLVHNAETFFFGRDLKVTGSIGQKSTKDAYDYRTLSELLRVAQPGKTMEEAMGDPSFPGASPTFRTFMSDEKRKQLFESSASDPSVKERGIAWARNQATELEKASEPKTGNLFDFVK